MQQSDATERVDRTDTRRTPVQTGVWRLHVLATPDSRWLRAILTLRGPYAQGLLIGRVQNTQPSILLEDSTLSRRHVTISLTGDGLLAVTDHGSSNGTFVDGQPVERDRQVAIGHGSVLRLGANVLVVERDFEERQDTGEPTAEVPGRSEKARELRGMLADAAGDLQPVLLHGETGTGKEYAAKALHVQSKRPGMLVRVNAAAIPESLFEAELFGHVAGAYTGATGPRAGRIREAQAGTLVLDEIGELPVQLQPKLLRVLEEKTLRPVGAAKDENVNVRFCASTNADLEQHVHNGRFRRDLLARFRTHVIELPPLRERRADLLPLADELLPLTDHHGKPQSWSQVLHEETVEALLLYAWPENLRELLATLVGLKRRIGQGPLGIAALPTAIRLRTTPAGPLDTVPGIRSSQQLEAPDPATLRQVLTEERGVLENVARRYGRHRKQVYRWLDQAGIDQQELEKYRQL